MLNRVLKAEYYQQCDFLEAKLGSLPSYTSQSIWVVKDLLQDGFCWRVGKRDHIFVQEHAWLPGAENYKVSGNINDNSIIKVLDLIDHSQKKWKLGLIKDTFEESVIDKILRIPLARLEHEDMLVWKGEPSGVFSVRSGYK